jgi:hypothetical protein
MISRKICILWVLLILILSSIVFPVYPQNVPWWDKNWSFRQEITIPVDTSLEIAKYQPVDIRVTFNDPCWAKNTEENSIRVCCWDGKFWYELESQIYDLDKSDDTHIKSCSLVFLIPKEANGKESYFIYYDDGEKSKANYPDHVTLTREHYYYEPIPGQKVDMDYYKITNDGFCVYGIGIQGMMLTEYSSQMIFRQSKGQKDFSYKYWDRLGTFCFQYVDKSLPVGQEIITTRMKLISSEIFVEGNLMVQFGIISTTSRDDAKTTNIYKYYYSPVDLKRICVNVKHEVLKDISVAGGEKVDGEYAFTSGFKTRSEANPFLNTGEILPYIHYYNQDGMVKGVQADTDPKSRDEEWIVSVEDNADLGNYPWVSADSGETGKAHALIFSSNNVVKSGKNEQDGIQIKGSQKQEVDIPGLKAYSSGIGCFRNAYSHGGSPDLSIPSDLIVEFDGEFFTTEINSYKDVEKEAVLFQSLVKNRPLPGGNISGGETEGKKYNLTVFTHFAFSFPLGSLISAATGKNFSYTYAELYQNGNLISSAMCSRISLAGELNLEKITLAGIIKLFDWKNISFFKKVKFPSLSPGEYVVKIYIRTRNGNKYVGVQTINLKEDTKTHIFCRKQGTIKITVNDQNNKLVSNAQCYLILGNMSIAEAKTTENEKTIINAPRGSYLLRIIYNGFKIYEKEVKVGILKKEEKIKIELSNIKLLVTDKLGLSPGVKITPTMTSDEMEIPVNIQSEEEKPGVYHFMNLTPASYDIQISYKQYLDKKTIQVQRSNDDTISMVFSAVFKFTVNVFDAMGNPLGDTKIIINREGKKLQGITDSNGIAVFEIPVGFYNLKTFDNEKSIGEKTVSVLRDETTFIVTSKEPLLPLIIIVVSALIITIGIALIVLKKISLSSFLRILAIAVIFIALVMPWWELSGSSNSPPVERSTKAFLVPQTMVTKTTFGNSVEAELANVPVEFTTFVFAVMIVVIATGFLIFYSVLVKKYRKTSISLAIISMILLIAIIGVFTYAFSQLTNVGLESLQGSGTLNVLIPGTNNYVDIPASWGLSVGVYLSILAIILVLISLFLDFRNRPKMKEKI